MKKIKYKLLKIILLFVVTMGLFYFADRIDPMCKTLYYALIFFGIMLFMVMMGMIFWWVME